MNNNAAESWNAWAKDVRGLPPAAMVDKIRRRVMRMMDERREEGEFMAKLCPAQEKILGENQVVYRNL